MSIITTLEQLSPELRAIVEAQIEAAKEEGRKIEREAQEELAKRSMTMADIVAERNQTIDTIKRTLEGANVVPTKVGNTKFYDRVQVMKAFIKKDENILRFHGLLHMVQPQAASTEKQS